MAIHLPKIYRHYPTLLEALHYLADGSLEVMWGKSNSLFKVNAWIVAYMNTVGIQLCGTLKRNAQLLVVP